MLIDDASTKDAVQLDLLVHSSLKLGRVDPVVIVIAAHSILVRHRDIQTVPGLNRMLAFEGSRFDVLPLGDFKMVMLPIQEQILLAGGKHSSWLDLQVMVNHVQPVTSDIGKRITVLDPGKDLTADLKGLFQDRSYSVDRAILRLGIQHHVADKRIVTFVHIDGDDSTIGLRRSENLVCFRNGQAEWLLGNYIATGV